MELARTPLRWYRLGKSAWLFGRLMRIELFSEEMLSSAVAISPFGGF
jgi:hypothetical protein